LLDAGEIRNSADEHAQVCFYTSGDTDSLASMLPKLLGEGGLVKQVAWLDDRHVELR